MRRIRFGSRVDALASRLVGEGLETRTLLNGSPISTVADLPNWSNLANLTVAGHSTFFTGYRAFDSINSLYVTNGSTEGTQRLGNVVVMSTPGIPSLVRVGDYVYFEGWDFSGGNGAGLWRSDGTTAGTILLRTPDDNPTGHIDNLVDVIGTAYFTRFQNGVNELWKSNGDPGGTAFVTNIRPIDDGRGDQFIGAGGKLYFQGYDPSTGFEPWVSDGTPNGTHILKDLSPGVFGSTFQVLGEVDGRLYFTADADSDQFHELWVTDGTEAGTLEIVQETADWRVLYLAGVVDFHGDAYFIAANPHGSELWKTDGTAEGTMQLVTVEHGYSTNLPHQLQIVGDALYFAMPVQFGKDAIWKSDGTSDGTQSETGFDYPGISKTFAIRGELYFVSRQSDMYSPLVLWRYNDGSPLAIGEVGTMSPYQHRSYAVNGDMLYWMDDNGLGNYISLADLRTPGDANNDSLVDGADYTVWADYFLTSPASSLLFSHGDFNRDGFVDGADYILWADNFRIGQDGAASREVMSNLPTKPAASISSTLPTSLLPLAVDQVMNASLETRSVAPLLRRSWYREIQNVDESFWLHWLAIALQQRDPTAAVMPISPLRFAGVL